MKYYKILRGYGAEDFIQIDETELEKAYGAFLLKKDGIYSGGAVRGSEIISIQPDYHRIMGWNRGYKLQPEDYEELKSKEIDKNCMKILSETRDKINYLISNGNENLIGRGFEMPKIDKKHTEISGEVDSLVNQFKV